MAKSRKITPLAKIQRSITPPVQQTTALGNPSVVPSLPPQTNEDKELVNNSVTRNDHLVNVKRDGAGSVFYFAIGANGGFRENFASPSSMSNLPYWSHYRDRVLRSTVHMEGFWSDVVAMWCSKMASQSWSLKGIRIQRLQSSLLNGWGNFMMRMGRDFLTTDNGCFAQIVRASSAAGSRVLGLVPLSSVRTTRTGDPDYPLIYQDLMGRLHALRAHEVIMIADMTSPEDTYYGVGLCSASRSFDSIVTLASIEQLVQEKTTGNEPTGISFVNASINEVQLQDAVNASKEQRVSKGYMRYMGVVIVPLVNLDANPTVATIPLKSLPDGFNAEQERENAQRKYALATGLDPQTINPRLIGSGSRGTSAQSVVLKEEQQGLLPAFFKKELTHNLNECYLPPAVTFFFGVKDYAEELKLAQIRKINAETRQIQVASGEINADMAREIAVENDELPARFVSRNKIDQPLSDSDKPDEVKVELETPVDTAVAQPNPTLQTKEYKEYLARQAVERALGQDAISLATIKEWEEIRAKLVTQKEASSQVTVQPQPIYINLPPTQIDVHSPNINIPPTIVNVPAPSVQVDNHIPASNVNIESPQITVQAPQVRVDAPNVSVTNHVPTPSVENHITSPQNIINLPDPLPAQVIVNPVPDKDETLDVIRDGDGLISKVIRQTRRK